MYGLADAIKIGRWVKMWTKIMVRVMPVVAIAIVLIAMLPHMVYD